MSTRTPVIAGNWKMNKTTSEAKTYIEELSTMVAGKEGVEVVVCPPATSLFTVSRMLADSSIIVAGQNMHFEDDGAFTGEISAAMLTDIGVTDVILGHSERREFFCETDEALAKKVVVALDNDIRPILCVGETDDEREAGKTREKLQQQISEDLADITVDQLPDIIIAYEPIWAIGTGKTATPEIAQDTCAFIRKLLSDQFSTESADKVRILYGGSVKPENISELMAEADIDGALVGGACLSTDDFSKIVDFS